MKIILYKSLAEKNRVNKEEYLTEYLSLEGNFRAPSSIVNPIFTIESNKINIESIEAQYLNDSQTDYILSEVVDDENNEIGISPIEEEGDQSNLLFCNYAYIPSFKRYYFINDITAISSKVFQLTLAVDVLMSFKDDFLKNTAFITRNENDYSSLIADSRKNFYADREIEILTPTNGTLKNISFASNNIDNNIVISTAVIDSTIINFNTILPPSNTELPTIRNRQFNNANASMNYVVTASTFGEYCKFILHTQDVQSFALRAFAFPFEIPHDSTLHNIQIEERNATDYEDSTAILQGYYPTNLDLSSYLVLADFELDSPSVWTELNPYTRYEFYFPFFGFVEIDPEKILGKHLIVYYTINYSSGDSEVNLYSITDNALIYSSACSLAVPLSLLKSDMEDIWRRKDILYTNTLVSGFKSAVSGIAGVAGGIKKEDYLSAISSGVNNFASLAGLASNFNDQMGLIHGSSNVDFQGGTNGLYKGMDFFIKLSKSKMIEDDSFIHLNGLPLNDSRLLSSLSGYTEVGNIHLEYCGEALSTEQNEIINLLRAGVIL